MLFKHWSVIQPIGADVPTELKSLNRSPAVASFAVATWGHCWKCILHSPANDHHCNSALLMRILVGVAVVSTVGLPRYIVFRLYVHRQSHCLHGHHEKNSVQMKVYLQLAYCSQGIQCYIWHQNILSNADIPFGDMQPFMARTIEEALLPPILWMDLWSLSLPKGFSVPMQMCTLLSSSFSGFPNRRLEDQPLLGRKVLFLFPSMEMGVYSSYICPTSYCPSSILG